jgi:hypothetical protein
MALAVLVAGGLRAALPPQLRSGDARWLFVVVVVGLLIILILGDPGYATPKRPVSAARSGGRR